MGRSRDRAQRDTNGSRVEPNIPPFAIGDSNFRPILRPMPNKRGLDITVANPRASRLSVSDPVARYVSDPSAMLCRRCSSIRGMLICTGQASRHAPHSVDALGRSLACPTPTSPGVTIEPIGPGYTHP